MKEKCEEIERIETDLASKSGGESGKQVKNKSFVKNIWFILISFLILLIIIYFSVTKLLDHRELDDEDKISVEEVYLDISEMTPEFVEELTSLFVAIDNYTAETGYINLFEDFISSEIKIMEDMELKVNEGTISEADLEEFRLLMESYTSRRQSGLSAAEITMFNIYGKLTVEYDLEFLKTAIDSWDKERIILSSKFKELATFVYMGELFSVKYLEEDLELIYNASIHKEVSRDELVDELELHKLRLDHVQKMIEIIWAFRRF